jgi:Mannosyltransferase (PIG-V)
VGDDVEVSRAPAPALRGGGAVSRLLGRPDVVHATVALLASRVLIWAVGVTAFLAFAISGDRARYDHGGLTQSFGDVGNALAAPAVRWDSNWYFDIARHGYRREDVEPAFFPLYPLLMRGLGEITGSVLVAGMLISLVAFLVALVLLSRLTALELDAAAGRRAVVLLAFFPAALFFSAVYTESLFLALELGAVYAARRGRWGWAGVIGALGSASRNTGALLVVLLAILYLYGPREDRPPDHPEARGLRPRYRLRADALWIPCVFAGLAAYLVYMQAHFGDWLAPLHAQEHFDRSFEGPLSSLWLGAEKAWESFTDILGGSSEFGKDVRAIAQFTVAAAAVAALVDVVRRLPAAYGAYAVVSMVAILSFPYPPGPLASTVRYIAAVFPLFMWLGWRLSDRRLYAATVVAFAGMLVYCAGMFATWHFVA